MTQTPVAGGRRYNNTQLWRECWINVEITPVAKESLRTGYCKYTKLSLARRFCDRARNSERVVSDFCKYTTIKWALHKKLKIRYRVVRPRNTFCSEVSDAKFL